MLRVIHERRSGNSGNNKVAITGGQDTGTPWSGDAPTYPLTGGMAGDRIGLTGVT